jgi:hypothetical protein
MDIYPAMKKNEPRALSTAQRLNMAGCREAGVGLGAKVQLSSRVCAQRGQGAGSIPALETNTGRAQKTRCDSIDVT